MWTATESDREWAEDILFGLKVLGWPMKQIAATLEIDEAQLQKQLSLQQQWGGYRECRLPVRYHVAVYARRLSRWGLLQMLDLVQITLGSKPMAKADLPPAQYRQIKEA